jgi:hypothetical protein
MDQVPSVVGGGLTGGGSAVWHTMCECQEFPLV